MVSSAWCWDIQNLVDLMVWDPQATQRFCYELKPWLVVQKLHGIDDDVNGGFRPDEHRGGDSSASGLHYYGLIWVLLEVDLAEPGLWLEVHLAAEKMWWWFFQFLKHETNKGRPQIPQFWNPFVGGGAGGCVFRWETAFVCRKITLVGLIIRNHTLRSPPLFHQLFGRSTPLTNRFHDWGFWSLPRKICAPEFVRVWRVGDSNSKGVGIVVAVEAGGPHDDQLEAGGAEGEGQSSMVALLVSSHKERFGASRHNILLVI